MNTISTLIRHALTFLAGLGGLLLASRLISPGDVPAANDAGRALIEPLTLLGGLLAAGASRLVLAWAGNLFRIGAGEPSGGASGGMLLLVVGGLVIGTAAVGLLPSCSANQRAAARAVPVKVCYITAKGPVCYSSSEGLSAEIDTRSHK